jgi:hypothetical protein
VKVVSANYSLEHLLVRGVNISRATQSVEELKNVITSTTSVLNIVNCSSAPVSQCDSLNRKRCGLVAGTCGECRSGFIGASGPSNTPCLPKSSRRLQHVALSDFNQTCGSDLDCDLGLFLECNLESERCQPLQKSCPNSCSGHGRCIFSSKYDPNATMTTCGLLDVECVSRCSCDDGFMGSSCSTKDLDYVQQRRVRGLLLGAISEMMKMENVDRSSVLSWLILLSSLTTEYSGLSEESKELMSVLCEAVLLKSLELGLSFEDISGIERVIDVSLSMEPNTKSKRNVNGVENSHTLSSLLELYSGLLVGDMLEGQNSYQVITSLFRTSSFSLSSSSVSTGNSSAIKLASPQSPLESFAGNSSRAQTMILPSSVRYPLRMSLVETLPSTVISPQAQRNASELSNPFGGVFYGFPCESETSSTDTEAVCEFQLELVHRSPVSDDQVRSLDQNHTSEFFEASCDSGVVEDHQFQCSSGDELIIHCDGSRKAVGRRYCPTYSPSSTCKSMGNGNRNSSLDMSPVTCELVSFDSFSTVCRCNISSSPFSHPLGMETAGGSSEAISDSGSVQFSVQSVGRSVAKEFVSTWKSAGSLSASSVQESAEVLATVGSIGIIFLLLMGLTGYWDVKDRKNEAVSSSLENASTNMFKGGNRKTQVGSRVTRLARPTQASHSSLIDRCLPSIFKSDSLWLKFTQEMKVYHRWLGIVFYYSPEFPRAMRVLSLFSSIVIMLFIQSVTYNISDPDDGSCEACDDESCCLSLKSTLNLNEDRCSWKVDGSSDPLAFNLSTTGESCHFRSIAGDLQRVFIVAILSAIISAPFSLTVQYLISNILSAETLKPSAGGDDLPLPTRRARFSSHKGEVDCLREECGVSLFDDLKNLMKDLSLHRSRLTGEKSDEFTGMISLSPSLSPSLSL